MRTLSKIAIVGAGAAGLAAAETLRLEQFSGEIALFGDEGRQPYDRPPLSKQILSGKWDIDRIQLRTADHLADLGITLDLDRSVVALDTANLRIAFADGSDARFDGIILCTGVKPRALPFGHDLRGVHVLRTVDDVAALRADLADATHVVVIGAGFLGTEVAATTRDLGLEVTVVETMEVPLLQQLGPTLGQRVADLHRQRGVDILTGVKVAGIGGVAGRVSEVRLSDGQCLRADVVLVTIGSTPAVDWLAESGLDITDGIVCDEFCCAAPGIYAAGDVAAWYNPRYGRLMRVEHRLNATEQAAVAAKNLVHGDTTVFAPIPYFWSDQFDTKIHAFGLLPPEADLQFTDGALTDNQFVARYSVRGKLVGVLGWNRAKQARQYRAELDVSASQPQRIQAEPNGTHN